MKTFLAAIQFTIFILLLAYGEGYVAEKIFMEDPVSIRGVFGGYIGDFFPDDHPSHIESGAFYKIDFGIFKKNDKPISFVQAAKEFASTHFISKGKVVLPDHYADIVIVIDGVTREFTAQEFVDRLGFKIQEVKAK